MARKLIVGVNDLATTHPDLALELVGTDPTTVSAFTNKVLLWRCPNHEEPYPQMGANRAKGFGCGYCRGRRVLPGFNDLATTHPDLAKDLVGTDPRTVVAGTNQMLLWRCPNHSEPFPCTGNNRLAGRGCGYCRGFKILPGFNDMATTHPELAVELFDTDPTTVLGTTTAVLLWRCPNHEEPYPSVAANRIKGYGCSFCSGRRLLPGFNDMTTTHPELARQVVGVDPRTIIAGTPKKLLWRCPNHEEPFPMSGANRVAGHACGFCTKQQVLAGFNDLASTHPHIAAELVDLNPETVIAGTSKKLTWRCRDCGTTWTTTGSARVGGSGCPSCSASGYDVSKPAHLYLMSRPGEQQFGITGDMKTRIATHRRSGWSLIDSLGPIEGGVALRLESELKQWLQAKVGPIEGKRENWRTSSLTVESLKHLLHEAEVEPPVLD
jgi:predicted GIY-YIG superfamily endonuclease